MFECVCCTGFSATLLNECECENEAVLLFRLWSDGASDSADWASAAHSVSFDQLAGGMGAARA